MMNAAATKAIRQEVEYWLEEVVIGLNLCPFAARPHRNRQVRISVTDASDEAELLSALQSELVVIAQASTAELETTLLVIPQMLVDFSDYNQFLDLADALLQRGGWEGRFQVASFHPHYCFAGVEPNDAENLTNRSPYPILHLIREASVEQALSHYPDAEQIPQRNIQRVRALTAQQKRLLFPYLSSTFQ